MFFEEGWVPLSEVTAEVFRRLQALEAEGAIPNVKNGLRATLAVSVWELCDACTKIGVTGPDGTVVSASKDLLAWADPTSLSNEHINVLVGSVGSSDLPDVDGKPPTPHAMVLRYGPFMHLPMVLPTNNVQSSMTFLEEEVKNYDPRDPEIVNAAKAILKMAQAGNITRETARKTLGSGLSRRKLKYGWALAAKHHSDLAAPNRWAGL